MVRALKRIAVEVHNVAVHDHDLMRISSLSGLDYTTSVYIQYSIFNNDLSDSCACTLERQPNVALNRIIVLQTD